MSSEPKAKGKNYADFSREELLAEIARLKSTKKYGLVWEHKKENVIEDFKNGAQPVLKEVTEKRIENAPGEQTNLIIEGDNFDALSILNYTHAGKVDVIYIDPPYNTGNKDFIYNDNYVDAEDEFRHSKWLSFMEPRLKLAKNLLKDNGAIFISIDDNEQSSLKCLCDDIFGAKNFVANIVWQNKYTVSNDKKNGMTIQTESIIVYAKDNEKLSFVPDELDEDYVAKSYKNPDNDPRGAYMTVQLYKKKNPYTYSIISPTGAKWEKPWNYTEENFEKLMNDGRVYWGKDGKACPRKKVYLSESSGKSHRNLWTGEEVGFQQEGGDDVEDIFGNRNTFSYPKPSSLIRKIIDAFNEDSIVVDFFAGSGTTGQAALELNKVDGGHRQFILCTNNGDKGEGSTKIAEEITYPRVKTVITGRRTDGSKYSDGIPANLRYYKIEHEEKKPTNDSNRFNIASFMEEIIQVKENAFDQVEVNEDVVVYKSSDQYVAIVFDSFALSEAAEIIKDKNTEKLPAKFYVFSYSRDALEDDLDLDFETEFVAMPEGLLKTYANIITELKKDEYEA